MEMKQRARKFIFISLGVLVIVAFILSTGESVKSKKERELLAFTTINHLEV